MELRTSGNVTVTGDIEEKTVTSEIVSQALRTADMVFLDIRGDGKAVGICERVPTDLKIPVALFNWRFTPHDVTSAVGWVQHEKNHAAQQQTQR